MSKNLTHSDLTYSIAITEAQFRDFLAIACRLLQVDPPELSGAEVSLSVVDWRHDESEKPEDRTLRLELRVES